MQRGKDNNCSDGEISDNELSDDMFSDDEITDDVSEEFFCESTDFPSDDKSKWNCMLLPIRPELLCYPFPRCPENYNPLLSIGLQKKLAKMNPREFLRTCLYELSLEQRESIMVDEGQRRRSFLVNWPLNDKHSGVKMAQAGFYCTDDYDRVQCVFCRGSLHNWESDDDNPLTEHAKYFPFCRFVKGLECGNIECKDPVLSDLSKVTVKESDWVTDVIGSAIVPQGCCITCFKKTGQRNTAHHIGLPCGHMLYCDKCNEEEMKKSMHPSYTHRCPYRKCGAPLTSTFKVFYG